LVKAVVWKRYAKKPSELYDDLVQEGVIGLLEAIDAYDPAKGTVFSGFVWSMVDWRLKGIYPKLSCSIFMPVRQSKLWRRAWAVTYRLTDEMGREPTYQEVADECGEPVTKVAAVLSVSAVSADTPRGQGSTLTLMDSLASNGSSPEEIVEEAQFLEYVGRLASELKPAHREVVNKYIGLKGERQKNFSELAEERGQVRQTCSLIFRNAMVTLRQAIEV